MEAYQQFNRPNMTAELGHFWEDRLLCHKLKDLSSRSQSMKIMLNTTSVPE
jgi:hypothetical protein